MIICDSREKKNQHILDYFSHHNIEYEIRKLDTADYWNDENPNVLIDRKQNLNEGAQEEYNMAKIKKVIFNKPMTIVMWADGTKTMCKATKGTAFREEAGLAICFMKKAMGMTNTQFGKMVDKYKEEGTVVKKSSKKKKEENK